MRGAGGRPDPCSEFDLFPGVFCVGRGRGRARAESGVCRRVFRRGALGIRGMVVDAAPRPIAALARCLPRAVLEPTDPSAPGGPPTRGTSTAWTNPSALDGVARLAALANGGAEHAYVIDSGVRAPTASSPPSDSCREADFARPHPERGRETPHSH